MSTDQSSDDAEFAAFLNGEGDLADSLQALPQPAPSAALDAAILARARADMAREARPQAANDAHAYGRWRLPAGLAAAVLAGVLGHQAWKSNADAERAALEPRELAGASPAVRPAPAAPAADLKKAAPQAVPEQSKADQSDEVQLAPKPSRTRTRARDDATAEMAKPAPPHAERSLSASGAASLSSNFAPPPPPPAPASVQAPTPAPAAAAIVQPMPSASVSADSMFRRSAEYSRSALASSVAGAVAPPAPPAPAAQAVAPAPLAYGAAPQLSQRVEVTGSAIKRSDAQMASAPVTWLNRIAALLEGGDKPRALAEWRAFRVAYPDYPVEAPLADAIKAAQE